jgi:predicted DCC family thiol-disulfide oxidoreductase YuxK
MDSPTPAQPILLYDGGCGFCVRSLNYWMRQGEGSVVFSAVQDGSGAPYGFHADQPMGAVHLIETTGEIRRGAAASFRMMDLCGSRIGRAMWFFYLRIRIFRKTSDWVYGLVARHRALLSKATCGISG